MRAAAEQTSGANCVNLFAIARTCMASAFRRSASLLWRKRAYFFEIASWWCAKLGRGARRENGFVCVIASAAKQSRTACAGGLDCFVAPLLAMTSLHPPPHEVRGRGTTRSVVEEACGAEACCEAN